MHCGYPHPDLLLAVINERQRNEIMAYANIEPIGGQTGVSSPPKEKIENEIIESKIDAVLDGYQMGQTNQTNQK